MILSNDIPPGDLLSLLGKWISWWSIKVHNQEIDSPNKKTNLLVVYHREICFPYWENESPGGEIPVTTFLKWAIFLLITVISDNASSRKLENWSWFSTCVWENPVLVSKLPGEDKISKCHTFAHLKVLCVDWVFFVSSFVVCFGLVWPIGRNRLWFPSMTFSHV